MLREPFSADGVTPRRIVGTLNAHAALKPRDRDELIRLGIPATALMEPTPIHSGYIVWVSADRFEFEHHLSYGRPERAFLLLVQDCGGAPLDVVAWQPQTGSLGSWLGYAWGLGEDTIYQPRITSEALPVWRSPVDWLRAERHGVVLLRPRLAAGYLCCAAPLQAEDIHHGAHLRQALTIPAPRIVVAAEPRRAA